MYVGNAVCMDGWVGTACVHVGRTVGGAHHELKGGMEGGDFWLPVL